MLQIFKQLTHGILIVLPSFFTDKNMNTSNDSCQKATEDPKVDILKQVFFK